MFSVCVRVCDTDVWLLNPCLNSILTMSLCDCHPHHHVCRTGLPRTCVCKRWFSTVVVFASPCIHKPHANPAAHLLASSSPGFGVGSVAFNRLVPWLPINTFRCGIGCLRGGARGRRLLSCSVREDACIWPRKLFHRVKRFAMSIGWGSFHIVRASTTFTIWRMMCGNGCLRQRRMCLASCGSPW